MSHPTDLPNLLLSLYTASELRRFVRWGPDGRALSDRLPEPGVTPAELASRVVELYEREGLIDGLEARLLHERPRRATDIRYVFQLRSAPAPTRAAPGEASSALHLPGTLERSVTGMGWDLFLVHASPDKAVAHRVFDAARERARTFLDAALPAGTPWDAAIDRALRDSAVIAVLITGRDTDEAHFLRAEVQVAIGLARATRDWIRVVPVHLDGPPSPGGRQTYGLGLYQGPVLDGPDAPERAAERLVAVVNEVAPLHRLAQLLRVAFPEPEALAAWIATVPRVDPLVDPGFRVDPTLSGPEPWRQAVRQLHERGRTDAVLFDALAAATPEHAGLVDAVRATFA